MKEWPSNGWTEGVEAIKRREYGAKQGVRHEMKMAFVFLLTDLAGNIVAFLHTTHSQVFTAITHLAATCLLHVGLLVGST